MGEREVSVFCTAGFWHWNSLTHLCLAHYTVTATVSIASQNETHTTFRFKQNPLEIFPPLIFCFKRPKWTSKISTAFGFSTIHIFFFYHIKLQTWKIVQKWSITCVNVFVTRKRWWLYILTISSVISWSNHEMLGVECNIHHTANKQFL